MSDGQMVIVEKLVKVYPGGTRAVSGVDFTVSQGEFFAFLGPNGAGKSTTMKVLSTLLRKTSGRVVVASHDVDRDPRAVRRSIGFAMQEVGLDDLVTGWDLLVLQGILYGQSRREARRRAEELLDLVGLTPVAGRKVGTYSGGMRRRLDLVAALVHRPPLLFLDEPTTGLDPQTRLTIWEYLTQLNKQGVTVFLTTQMMEEADRLCQRIAIIDQGQIVAQGSPRSLKAEVGGDVVHVTLASQGREDGRSSAEEAERLATGRSYVAAVERTGTSLTVRVKDGSAAVPDLLRVLHESGVAVTNLSVASPTLDDVFLKYTGRKIRVEEAKGDEVAATLRPWLGLRRR
ncbi:MAG: ATP-binding cassette domain-containing protein [Chloroflexi bacterium]|nr:ATP-binding cassette domain-containing protein [Chloroflexota bacterium]